MAEKLTSTSRKRVRTRQPRPPKERPVFLRIGSAVLQKDGSILLTPDPTVAAPVFGVAPFPGEHTPF